MQINDNRLLSISQVTQRSGVPASALRYYESLGLISSVRNDTKHRRFHRSVLRRIAIIVFAQKIGYCLDEVSELLKRIPDDHVPTDEDWAKLTTEWRARVRAQIAELQRLDISLDECIGCGCLSVRKCKLANPHDWRGEQGAGPRRWIADAISDPQERIVD